jgi:hemolysin activation/secretion protein
MRAAGERRLVSKYLVLTFAVAALVVPAARNSAFGQQPNRPLRSEPSNAERYTNPPAETPLQRPAPVQVHTPEQQEEAPSIVPFTLAAVRIEGARAVPADKISSTYSEKIGSTVTGTDVLEISRRITELYRNAGFHLSRAIIPPQDLKSGVLRIDVVEGSIEQITLAGGGRDPIGILPILQPITLEQPSRLSTLERQLLLVNDRPGARVTDVNLAEIGSATGKFRLIVTVETWRVYWTQGLDNYGTGSTGPLQGYSSAAFNSYLLPGDSIAVAASTVPDATEELRFGKAAYDAPIGLDGARMGFSAYQSTVRPGDDRRFFSNYTRTTGYELRGSIVPILSRESSLTLIAAANYTDAYEGDVGGLYYADKIRAGSLSADYKLKDSFNGWNNLVVTLRQGFGFGGASRIDDPMTSRYGASGEFTAVNLAYIRLHTFSDIWSTKLAVTSQFAANPLLLSQQYFLGGAAFGPGYYSGDNGVGGSFEVRFDQKTPWQYLQGYQLYGFVDGGQVWDRHDGIRASLASLGAGARFFLSDALTGSLSIAFPVHDRFGSPDPSNYRILFSVLNYFKVCPEGGLLSCQRR